MLVCFIWCCLLRWFAWCWLWFLSGLVDMFLFMGYLGFIVPVWMLVVLLFGWSILQFVVFLFVLVLRLLNAELTLLFGDWWLFGGLTLFTLIRLVCLLISVCLLCFAWFDVVMFCITLFVNAGCLLLLFVFEVSGGFIFMCWVLVLAVMIWIVWLLDLILITCCLIVF